MPTRLGRAASWVGIGMEGTFETWRYMYEGNVVPFNEGNMIAVFKAVETSVIHERPDFRPWPGVIWEGRDFT